MFSFTNTEGVESAWSQTQKKIESKRQETETVVEKVKRKVKNFLTLGFWDTEHRDARRVVTTSKSARTEISVQRNLLISPEKSCHVLVTSKESVI